MDCGTEPELQQRLRRQLLALHHGEKTPDKLGRRFEKFTSGVSAEPVELRPLGDAVLDVLLVAGLTRQLADDFVGRYQRAVWGGTLASSSGR